MEMEVRWVGRWVDLFSRRRRERYEYRCLWCGFVNVRYELCARVVCDRCGEAFYGWR